MDFDRAAARLQKDQSKLKGRGNRTLSERAKREAQQRKQQQERRAAERARQQQQHDFQQHLFNSSEAKLGVRPLGDFRPYSVHGEGDKITLPPSLLELLSQSTNDAPQASPWTFRIAIRNPEYSFPASKSLREKTPPVDPEDDNNDMSTDSDEDDDERDAFYTEELSHKYLAYTHGSVVEFTSEEGQVGIPRLIASALIRSSKSATFRTADPAAAVDTDNMEEDTGLTSGHIAWGDFDLPDASLEISLLVLPKGRSCVLTPTKEAVANGFYNLQDIKLVLEQSLIRTRATLSRGDLMHTWHRGMQYDLQVTSVVPSAYQAVLCINTDIEVEFGHIYGGASARMDASPKETTGGQMPGGVGRRLGDLEAAAPATAAVPLVKASQPAELLPEPPANQKEGVCTIQVRADTTHARRRFDVDVATVRDLYAFASTVIPSTDSASFQVVTRFPRRVIAVSDLDSKLTDAGFSAGQELLLLERL